MARKMQLFLNNKLKCECSTSSELRLALMALFEEIGWSTSSSKAEGMFRTAEIFRVAGELLLEPNNPSKPIIVPGIVNMTFAVELYLKVLAAAYDAQLWGHDLLKLFDSLPVRACAQVQQKLASPAAPDSVKTLADFRKSIEEIRSTFVTWRYSDGLTPTGGVMLKPLKFATELLRQCCEEVLAISKQREIRRNQNCQTVQIKLSHT